ncbi:sugar transferase [Micromonospora sp. NPDC003776]
MPLTMSRRQRRYERIKRVVDVVGAALALLLASPVMLVVAVVVLVALGRPILFRQVRPGRHGELFEVVKFRTLLEADPTRGLVTGEDRLTRVGRWLRASSLDELPELWNVLRGEMSLVGPRPLLVQHLEMYTPEQARRHEVRPGLTGLAQVRGRNSLSWAEKFRYDVWYVNNRSLALDLRILAETVRVVVRREGITVPDSVPWQEFRGAPAPVAAGAASSGPGDAPR